MCRRSLRRCSACSRRCSWGGGRTTAFSRKWYLLFIPAALLIGGVLINDLHQMAFRAAPGAATLEADYTHGWIYYLAMTWIVGLLLATGIIVYRKCRVSESRTIRMGAALCFSGRICVVRAELREYLHLSQDAGMLLPDVRGVLGKLPAGGAAADQRTLPLFLFRIHRRRADCGRAWDAPSTAQKTRPISRRINWTQRRAKRFF